MNPREKFVWKMQGGVLQARDLRRQGDLKGARDVLEQVAADARRAGVRSSELSHGLAVICDETGDLVAAHRYLQEALEADPLAAEVVEFREVLAAHIRQALASPDRDDDDPAVPEVYRTPRPGRAHHGGAASGDGPLAGGCRPCRGSRGTGERDRAALPRLRGGLAPSRPGGHLCWRPGPGEGGEVPGREGAGRPRPGICPPPAHPVQGQGIGGTAASNLPKGLQRAIPPWSPGRDEEAV